MELDFDDRVVRGLHGYLREVTGRLGLSGDSGYVHAERPVSAYLALEGRLPGFPDRDVALLWDEDGGWAIAVETHSGEDLLVQDRYGAELVPAPDAVARWVRSLLDGKGRPRRVAPPRRAQDDVAARLALYAVVPGVAVRRSA
ncbi:DUF6292 family protein [Actinokineospora soli]|uniref:DUF6292 family protein n=1 Tax=Actinokineospora soli TaxID=1048753 RepID=A0ABW2TI02_9PSEU